MTVLSKLTVADKTPIVVKVSIVSLASGWFLYKQWKRYNERKQLDEKNCTAINSFPNTDVDNIKYMIRDKNEKTPKAYVSRKFFKQLSDLMSVLFPSWVSTETGFLLLIAGGLIARSMCDLWLITIATQVESVIVSQNKSLFGVLLLKMLTLMPFVSVVNNVLKWSIGSLKLRLRKNLTLALYDDYLKSFTYYRIVNIDNRISNADQLLTTDVDKFCDCFCDLYSNLAKPTLDIALYMYRLTTNLGVATPSIMFSYLVVSGVILTWLRRPIGSFTVTEQKLEGEFRHINSRLITHSEEVAFYQGNRREKLILMASFQRLMRHLGKFLRFKAIMGILDNTIAKYLASVIGFYAVSIPFMSNENTFSKMNRTIRFQNYYTYGRMLVKLAEAIGRLVLAGRELTRLSGFTARVTQLREILKDINEGRYKRTMIGGYKEQPIATQGVLIFQDNVIRFDKVPLVTPNGDVLIKEISFEVLSGMNVLVCGPNGCGKSSLFRVLGELWPLFGGTLTKPPRGKLFYIPQRPYMTLGTLRDQLIYPHSRQEAECRGVVDAKLFEYLQLVQLPYLFDRENGLDAIEDWIDVLSGGEKQRIAMARLFYHSPQFAILDECTSAVSVDVEGSMYQYCREVGITLFTVSHRKSLWKHHDYYLKIDGQGNYEFNKINFDTEEFGS